MHPSRKQFLLDIGYVVFFGVALFQLNIIGSTLTDAAAWNICWAHYCRNNPKLNAHARPGSALNHFYEVYNTTKGE